MYTMNLLSIIVFAVAIGLAISSSSETRAATFMVNTTNDTVDAAPGNGICADSAGDCSLRAAVGETNQLALTVATRINTIVLPAGIYTLTLTGAPEINNASGDLNVRNSSNLTIVGESPRTTIVQAGTVKSTDGTDGNGIDRVIGTFNSGSVILSLNNLTIRHGKRNFTGSNSAGGGILYRGALSNTSGSLTINNCAIVDNFAIDNGGGISTDANVNVTGSLIAGNRSYSSTEYGGGMFAGNSEIAPATINFTNTTFSGNSVGTSTSGGNGGGLFIGPFNNGLPADVNVTNCTFTQNSGRIGGGLAALTINNTIRLRNTIIAANTATLYGNDVSTSSNSLPITIVSGGTNLIGDANTSNGWDPTDLLNNSGASLSPLGNYGGDTDTHSISAISAALNAGQNCVVDATCSLFNAPFNVTTDQRGLDRLVDGLVNPNALFVDIGSFEIQTSSAANVAIAGRVYASVGRVLGNAVVVLTGANGLTRTTRTNPFGYFFFDEIESGQTVVIEVRSKLFRFEPRLISVNDELNSVEFFPISPDEFSRLR